LYLTWKDKQGNERKLIIKEVAALREIINCCEAALSEGGWSKGGA
jgi:hypothetical protein